MGLTTILNAKKVARKLLLYNYWPGNIKHGFKDVRDDLLFRLTAVQNGLGVNFDSGKAVFSKNKRRIIVPAEILSRKDQALSLAMNFDRIFSIPDLQYSDNTVDFTKEIALMGYRVKTNYGMALELEGIKNYNRYYALKEGDVVFDCGAFHGIYALLISSKVGKSGRIFCFEPDEKNAEILAQNIKRNGIRNVVLVKKGIWKSEGKVSFLPGHGEVSSIVLDGHGKSGALTVDAVSIPGFVRQRNISRLDFVKMDIEGAELEAIEGCLDLLKTHRVNFGIASYHLRNGQETYHSLGPLFEKAGYGHATEITDTITTYAWSKGAKP